MEKIQIKSVLGGILFEHECYNNSIKKTVEFANLRSANLRSADLRFADLTFADLRFADLRSADLRFANLRFANLRSAKLRSADLTSANLRSADLRFADLRSADLRFANLRSANLRSAKLRFAKHLHYSILPEGDIIGYKKLSNGEIVKLLIPKEAKRVSTPIGRKCRAEYAKVIEIRNGRKRPKTGNGRRDSELVYKVGEIVYPDKYNNDFRVECANGIHFFITLKEAKEWKQFTKNKKT